MQNCYFVAKHVKEWSFNRCSSVYAATHTCKECIIFICPAPGVLVWSMFAPPPHEILFQFHPAVWGLDHHENMKYFYMECGYVSPKESICEPHKLTDMYSKDHVRVRRGFHSIDLEWIPIEAPEGKAVINWGPPSLVSSPDMTGLLQISTCFKGTGTYQAGHFQSMAVGHYSPLLSTVWELLSILACILSHFSLTLYCQKGPVTFSYLPAYCMWLERRQ